MINKKDISKIAKRIIRRQKGLRDHQIIHPRREWAIGLLVACLLLIGGASWSFVTYNEVSERDVQSVNTTKVEQNVYQEGLVEAALEEFRSRREGYDVLLDDTENTQPEIIEKVETPDTETQLEPEEPVESTDTDNSETESGEVGEIEESPTGPPEEPPSAELDV